MVAMVLLLTKVDDIHNTFLLEILVDKVNKVVMRVVLHYTCQMIYVCMAALREAKVGDWCEISRGSRSTTVIVYPMVSVFRSNRANHPNHARHLLFVDLLYTQSFRQLGADTSCPS